MRSDERPTSKRIPSLFRKFEIFATVKHLSFPLFSFLTPPPSPTCAYAKGTPFQRSLNIADTDAENLPATVFWLFTAYKEVYI